MTDDQAAAKAVCEHFYASHCYRGMSIRLCMICHEPDWDDLEWQLTEASIGAIPPLPSADALRAYMAATGWDQDGPSGSAGAIWRNGEAAIGVPHDFDQLLIEGAIRRVARKEGRSEWDVTRDIFANRPAS